MKYVKASHILCDAIDTRFTGVIKFILMHFSCIKRGPISYRHNYSPSKPGPSLPKFVSPSVKGKSPMFCYLHLPLYDQPRLRSTMFIVATHRLSQHNYLCVNSHQWQY